MLKRENVKEGLTHIIRSGSEDYSHPEKLHLCRNLWALPLGEINPVLCCLMWSADAKRHNQLHIRIHEPESMLMLEVVCVCEA